MQEKIKNILLYAGTDRETYEKVKPRLTEVNRLSLSLYPMMASLISVILYGLSFINTALESSRNCYYFVWGFCVLFFVLSNTLLKRKPALTTPAVCVFATMVLCTCAAYGTVIEPHRESLTFAIMIFAMPLLFIDNALHNVILILGNLTLYVIAASLTQDADVLAFNLTIIVPFTLFGLFITCFLVNKKIQSFILQDKTAMMEEIMKLNTEMEKARNQAEESNAAKTSFLFNMSHDIRTPMNAIIGFTNLLRKHQEEQDKREDYLKKIESSSNVLLSIINNVLEMARIEKGAIVVEETEWSVEQFDDTLYSIFHEMMTQKGITYTHQIDVQHHHMLCDITKVREVFINILSNAYKYTNTGGSISMQISEIPCEREGYAMYRTTIADTGIGMSEEFLPHLFEEFAREKNTTDNKIEGTGLGMPIVKRLLDLMGGVINVQSQQGVGTTVTITLSHKIQENAEQTYHVKGTLSDSYFQGKRILLAEDNELNAEIAIEILCEVGLVIEHAEDGVKCVQMLQEKSAGYYDAILMDIQMPNMNGYEATLNIRRLPDTVKSQIPILAMTANAFEEDKREALRVGMNGHLAKPINVTELIKMLAQTI